MKVLLDTHAFLWFIMGSANLSVNARALIEDPANERLLSVASLWEIAIKRAKGVLEAPPAIVDRLREYEFSPLPVSWEHAIAVGELPDHHRDPFDRMLIAQARTEGLTIVTSDPMIRRYQVLTISA